MTPVGVRPTPSTWALVEAFNRAVRDAVTDHRVVAGRPKRSLLDWYFRRAAISGMTDPFFLETLVASDVLPFERPMVVAHEWSHLAGVNDEGEANFVAWIACVRSTPSHRYARGCRYEEVLPRSSALIGRRLPVRSGLAQRGSAGRPNASPATSSAPNRRRRQC
jgi:hypothetical protein